VGGTDIRAPSWVEAEAVGPPAACEIAQSLVSTVNPALCGSHCMA
jgi:hypothetical protein